MTTRSINENDNYNYPLFVKGDFDGFIGLFIDNLINLLIITGLCLSIGMPAYIVFGKILPSTSLAVLAGNIFYSWQARRLAYREKRSDVTALPYGINTVTLFAFFSLIIAPVYIQTKDADLAWKVGVCSCFISGVFEGGGAFLGNKIRSITPRAALLSTLAGVGIVFIAIDQTIKIWDRPVIAFIPLALILTEYFSRVKLPFKIPSGFYAIAIGSAIAWGTGSMSGEALSKSAGSISIYMPGFVFFDLFRGDVFIKVAPYLSVAIPMGFMSFFSTIQNLESASAAGDNFSATPALAMNGIGTVIGSMFGSPFPTTVYIGHPGWKGLGARTGYSIINGVVITVICFTGLMGLITALIPLEAGYPILLWIGVIIAAQAFQTTPKEHAPAVVIGLLPVIASWGLSLLRQFINKDGGYTTVQMNDILAKSLPHLKSIVVFSEGAIFSSLFLSAVAVYMIEKDFLRSFYWSLPLIVLSYFGFIHSSEIGPGVTGMIPLGYSMFAAVILLIYFYNKKKI